MSYVAVIFLAVGTVHSGGDRRGPRTKAEIQRERHKLYDRTADEVDQIVAEFHAKFPRQEAKSVGAIYCRYSTRFQDSIADQVRKILEDAVRREIFVPREYVFFDLAVRGYKSQRAGLDELRGVLRSKAVSVVMFFATNRLFRKVHRTLEFVEEKIVERGVDAIFVKSGVDTTDTERWRMMLTFHSMMDEFVVGMYADNIRAAHEGLLEKRLVFGTISYGYGGEPIDGEMTRRGRPRRRLVVDAVTSTVVGQIFVWYVVDRLTIDEIIRRLNDDPGIPLPPRCTSGMWTRLSVLEIGRRLDCSDTNAWKAIGHWHRVRRLPVPTDKTRRAQIMNRAKAPYDRGMEIQQIAAELGYTSRGMKLLLKRWFDAHGQKMPDGRTRRHNQREEG